MKRRRRGEVYALWVATSLAACGDGSALLIGGQLSLSEESVDPGAEALPDPPTDAEATPEAPALELRHCNGERGGGYEVSFRVDERDLCVLPGCYADQLVVANDGSLWVHIRSGWAKRQADLLVHYAPDGKLLGRQRLDYFRAGALGVDVHGNAWLSVVEAEGSTAALKRFDPVLEPLPDADAPPTDSRFAAFEQIVAFEDQVVWVGETSARYDLDGNLLESCSELNDGNGRMLIERADDGFALVSSRVSNAVVERRDAAGVLLWHQSLSQSAAERPDETSPHYDYTRLGSDAKGNIFVARPPGPGPKPPTELEHCYPEEEGGGCHAEDAWAWFQRIDADGERTWMYEINTTLNLPLAVTPQGRLFTMYASGHVPGGDNILVEVAADGKSCEQHVVEADPPVEWIDVLKATSGDALYFASVHEFGRIVPAKP